MKTLNEMNNEQLTYLKEKWSAERKELDLDIIRSRERLTAKLDRQKQDQNEIDALKSDLTKAENLLQHLVSTSAPEEMIVNQQELVNKLNTELDGASKGRNVITDTEAYLQQANIDELALQKQYRIDKIAEIEGLLAA